MTTVKKNKIRVLLVEDDADYSNLVTMKLTHSDLGDFSVQTAVSMKEFKNKIDAERPDIILSDLGLPDSDGLETFRKVSALAGEIPIVVLTGSSDSAVGVEAVSLGAQDYLVKVSVRGDLLVHSILHAIERNRLTCELKRANEKLEKLADTDPLTGLLNRRGLEQVLTREFAYKKRYGTNFHMVMIDLDDFKSINERFGHSGGDSALLKVAESIKAAIRPTDYAARIGGDEFLVLLVHAENAEDVIKVADRLRLAIEQCEIAIPGYSPIHVTASAGLIDLGDDELHLDVIIRKAGSLLKQSKIEGKNRTSAASKA